MKHPIKLWRFHIYIYYIMCLKHNFLQERHLLVKVIDRVLYKLDDLVRPYVHKVFLLLHM